MTNLIKFALEAKFGEGINMDAILEVVEATGNAAVAVEKMVGIYEEPSFDEIIISKRSPGEKGECIFISFNPFKKEVTYSFLDRENVYKYFNKDRVRSALMYNKDQTLYVRKEHVKKFPALFFNSEKEFKAVYPADTCSYNSFALGELRAEEGRMASASWKND